MDELTQRIREAAELCLEVAGAPELAAILDAPAVRTVEFHGPALRRFYLDALRTQVLLRAQPRPVRLLLAPGAAYAPAAGAPAAGAAPPPNDCSAR